MAYAQPGVVCSLLDPGVCYLGNVTLLTGEAMAKTLAERQKEHRQRLKEQGYVKISEWVTPKQRQAIRAYLRGDADLVPKGATQEALQDNTPKASTKDWYSTTQAFEKIKPLKDINERTFRKWLEKGNVKGERIGQRWRIPAEEVEKLIAYYQGRK